MAVYTQLEKDQIKKILSIYDCGDLIDFEGILQGVENTNYRITTTRDKFILTVFEKRTNESDLPFFFDFMTHLHGHGVYCPFALPDRYGQKIQKVDGKSAALFSYLDGKNLDATEITPQKCFEMGELLARMHLAAADFEKTRVNSMSYKAWKALFEKIKPKAPGISLDLPSLIQVELLLAEKTVALHLPKAVVHADAFPDNVFEQHGKIYGVIDFYFSAKDFLTYDLAITLNAWCFESGVFNKDRSDHLLDGYERLRQLSATEKSFFSDMCRAAALRILMTRSHDWIFHDSNALVKPKDPLEYKLILEYHRDNAIYR